MKKIVNVDREIKARTPEKAFEKFFKKYPGLEYWKETFQYMAENGEDFFCDNLFGNGERNENWSYALHLDINDDYYYMAVIERA